MDAETIPKGGSSILEVIGLKTILYFLVLGSALYFVSRPRTSASITYHRGKSYVSLARLLAALALSITWFYILRFLVSEQLKYNLMPEAEAENSPNLFILAYQLVCDDPFKWFWSSQLLTLAIPVHLFLYVETFRHNVAVIETLAFIVVGLFGAQSFTFSLFFAKLVTMENTHEDEKEDPPKKGHLTFGILTILVKDIAFFSVYMIGETSTSNQFAFVAALILLHFVLLLPPFVGALRNTGEKQTKHFEVNFIFKVASAICFVYHILFVIPACLREQKWDFIGIILDNDCQTSITMDTIFMSLLCSTILRYKLNLTALKTCSLVALMPVLSPGAVFAWMYSFSNSQEFSQKKEA